MNGPSATQGIDLIWPGIKPLIGMVHLLPLPGSPGWEGSMNAVADRALADAETLEEAGLDGVLVENYGDVPFHRESVPPETAAAMAAVVSRVVAGASLPVGVNVLRNDARAALGVAAATGAGFIRVNVHTGVMWTDQGVIEGRAAETIRSRQALAPGVAILADVHVKHASPPPGLSPEESASDAWHRGLADAIIVSGTATGLPTDPGLARRVAAAVPEAWVLVGSGVRSETVSGVLETCDGAIVGTALTRDGKAGTGIDAAAARRFMDAARGTS
jgi:membrane complex biogenesis BtpA family protein